MTKESKHFIVLKSDKCSAPDEFLTSSVEVDSDASFEQLLKNVSEALHIALWKVISLVALPKSSKPSSDHESAKALTKVEDVIKHDGDVGILISGKRLRDVPGPTGGLPFLGGYSEIYPDFIGNQQRLLDKYGHLVRVRYMGKNVYYTDDPDIASVALSEGEYFKKELTTEHPLYALHENLPNGLFTSNSTNPAWEKSHKFMQVALGAKATRNYAKVMDSSAKKIVNVFKQFQEKNTSFDAFPWTMRVAGNTIGEIVTGHDLGMLDGPDAPIAPALLHIGRNLASSQALYRKGKIYRMLPQTPERRVSQNAEAYLQKWMADELKRTLDYHSKDAPMKDAAVETKSIMDYAVHALDEGGEKMPISLATENISTVLGAGQVTTSSLLAWILMVLSDHPDEAKELYAALLDAGLTKDSEPSIEELNKIDRLDWFIKETQRLYNPAFQPTRMALQDCIVPDAYFLPKTAQVTTALHSIMVNKEHWKDPYHFDVARWGREETQKRHSHAYIPFAAGGRSCIGFNIALTETKYILTRWVLNFTFENVTGEKVVYDPEFSLFRPLNLKIRVHPQEGPEKFKAAFKSQKAENKADNKANGAPKSKETTRPAVGRSDLPAFYAIHASNTGTAKGFASELTQRARKLGFSKVQLQAFDESPLASKEGTEKLAAENNLVVIITCTYNGEPPDAALDFDGMLDAAVKAKESDHFAGVHYTVFGCGNKQWGPTYQAFPNKVDASLKTLGADQFFKKGSGDANEDQDRDFSEWSTQFWGAVAAKHGIDLANPQGASAPSAQSQNSAEPIASDAIKVNFHPVGTVVPEHQAPVEGLAASSIVSNLELVNEDSPEPRGMRLITMTVPEGMSYRAGDHVEIVPENTPEAIELVLAKLHLVDNAIFSVEAVKKESVNASSLAAKLVGKGPINIREALTYYADLSAPVQRGALQQICDLLPEGDKTRAEIEELADPAVDKTKMNEFASKNRNFAALLAHYPKIADVLTLKELLLCVRSIATRRYSIASSPKADSKTLKICVGLVPQHTEDGTWEGLCSGFLKQSQPGHKIFIRPRPSQEPFHLPEDPSVEILMIGAGTGVAPFLGFLEERKARGLKLKSKGGNAAGCKMYYGTSYRDMRKLHDLLKAYVDEGYVEIEPIYSGDNGIRVFAQDLLIKDGQDVWSSLASGGRIYVCGSATRVGSGVEHAIGQIAEQLGGKNDKDQYVKELKKSGQLSEDVFG